MRALTVLGWLLIVGVSVANSAVAQQSRVSFAIARGVGDVEGGDGFTPLGNLGKTSDVIVSEAKDLLSARHKQILRFAQDDSSSFFRASLGHTMGGRYGIIMIFLRIQ